MNKNTADVSANEENKEIDVTSQTNEKPASEKKKERELPDWMLDKTTINELKFCRYFVQKHPLKCIKGRFYDFDGLVDENTLGNEIYRMLLNGIWHGLPKKVTLIMDTLHHYCYSEPLVPDQCQQLKEIDKGVKIKVKENLL